MHRIFSGDGWLEVLGIRVASGKAFAFEPGFVEKDEPSHRHASRVTGASQRVQVDFRRIRPPDTPQRTIGTAPPGARASRPHAVPSVAAQFSLRCCSRPPCRREPHGPGRSRGRAPLPVDSGGGDGRSCGRICAGGTPALPGGLPPMTGSHQRDKSAEAFWRRLSLKEVYPSSCLFVFIRGSSSLNNPVHPVHPCSISRKPV